MIAGLENLLSQTGRKILFAGIGNVLKSDDGVGVYISRRIKESENISSLTAEVSIENYIGKINSLKPDILVIIDCVDMGATPGTCKMLAVDEIWDFTFNTHNISLKKITEFFNFPVYILGIQPRSVVFGEKISYLVSISANRIIRQINNYKTNK
ncbi:MAG: hydrogenase maturation protease [Bacteroidales bacterium]